MRLANKIGGYLLLVALVPLVVFIIYIFLRVETQLHETRRDFMRTLAEEVGVDVARTLREGAGSLFLLARNPQLQSLRNRESIEEILHETQTHHPVLKDLSLLDKEGHVLGSYAYSFRGNLKNTWWFKDALAGEGVMTEVHTIIYPKDYVITIATPLKQTGGKDTRVLLGQISMEPINEIMRDLNFGEGGTARLVDRRGYVVATPSREEMLEPFYQDIIGPIIAQGRAGETTIVTDAGQLVVTYAPVPGDEERNLATDWKVVLTLPESEALAPVRNIHQGLILAVGISGFLVMLLIFFLRRQLGQRIGVLTKGARRLGGGEFQTRIDDLGNDELGTLGRAFNKAGEDLEQYDRELRAHQDELENKVEERTAALQAANDQLVLMGEVFEHSLEGIVVTDSLGTILQVNPAFIAITGYEEREAIGRKPSILKSDRHDDRFYKTMWDSLINQGKWEGEIWNRRKNGEAYPEWLAISLYANHSSAVRGYIGIFHDITDTKRQEELIRFQAFHDALTGLPNRLLLLDRLETATPQAQRRGMKLALLYLDLDNFKTVNDSLGHAAGDILLKTAAGRLKKVFREEDTVCRLGGDEFVVMMGDLESEDLAITMAERVQESLSNPFTIKERTVHVGTSIGISLFPDDGDDAEALLKNADMAMYRAKGEGKGCIRLFTKAMQERAVQRLVMEEAVRRGLTRDEFVVFFQPQMDLETGRVAGLEALVRWQRPGEDLVLPEEFIGLAEETGLILPLGEKVLDLACQEAAGIIATKGCEGLKVAVNLSAKQFQQETLPDLIKETLARWSLDPSHLEVEITETALTADVPKAVSVMERLRAAGVSIAVDDFGTGYSSLGHLREFPLSTLKIDKSFVHGILDNTADARIVETIIAMGGKLGLTVVAEGVENEAQLDFLKAQGCRQAQGFHLARPMPPGEALEFVKKKGC